MRGFTESEWIAKLERVWQVTLKEFRQILRDPRLARAVVIAPVIQLVLFGYAVSTDVRETALFVVDHDRTVASREVTDALTSSGYFEVVGRSEDPADMVRALDRGNAVVGLQIPSGFAADLQSGRGASVQALLDGTNSNTATVAQGYAERIVLNYGTGQLPDAPALALELRDRAWFNPELESRNYNVPAVVGAIILLVSLLLTSLAIVREREIGTLEQLRVSPLTPGELIAGKTLPFAVIGLADLVIVTSVAIFWFDVPFRGGVLTLLAAAILYLLSGLGIGLLISTISTTQQEAFMATFLIFQPAILLSGFMFPVSSMPEIFQWMTNLNPTRHFLVIVRSVFLKGAGPTVLWPQYLALAAIGTALLWFATARFRAAETK
jgi:ABC-2 type transport system permease protein